MAELDGRWVTISGRKVFIKEGQSLSDAMKSSKKFDDNNVKEKVPSKILPSGKRLFNLSKEDLKKEYIADYKDGDIIRTGEYSIYVKYGSYSSARLLTTVEKDMIKIRMEKWPKYIENFIWKEKE